MIATELELLKAKLDKGFFVQNLYEMVQICENLDQDEFGGVVFYVLRNVFLDIIRAWSECAVSVEESIKVQTKLEEPVRTVIEGLETYCNRESLFDSLGKLVVAKKQALKSDSD
ncbi:hypothetical protein KA005_63025 [bacterium]|nr:hypothetical protein [bacterium]